MGHLMKRMMASNVKVIQYNLFFHISLCSIFAATLIIYLAVAATHQKIQLIAAKDFAHMYIESPIIESPAQRPAQWGL